MASKAYQNQKCVLKYSKSHVDRAGRDIRLGCVDEKRQESIKIIQNYRETHLYPLMLIKNHLVQSARKVDKRAIVARRLKRLPTIIDKLERPTLDGKNSNAIKLTRMQDIGGCRVIVSNLRQLNELHQRLIRSRSVHNIIRTYDYLIPKKSGYGGIHLVYSCFLSAKEKNDWTKTKIEVQLRTNLQHAWATSLEIIDTLEGFNLKTSLMGHEKWRRFFKLSGDLVAHEEKAYILEEYEITTIIKELKELESELDAFKKLFKYNFAIQMLTGNSNLPKRVLIHQGLFLISLKNPHEDKNKKMKIDVNIVSFGPKETEEAFSALAKKEADPEVPVAVLVSAGDARNLKKAYPNYFGSTNKFKNFIERYLNKDQKQNSKSANK